MDPLSLDAWRKQRPAPSPAPLIVGTMNFGKRTPEAEATRIVDRALERGLGLFDTANAYVLGEGERVLGRVLKGRRNRALLATKVGLGRVGGAAAGLLQSGGRSEGLSRARILSACDESLKRLQTDVIDIYFLHVPDAATPIEDSLSAIATLIKAGKIRAFATSNYASWQVLEILNWCDKEGIARPIFSHQIYNLLVRQLDIEYFAFANRYQHHTTAYNPLAGGLLSGKHELGTPAPASRFDNNLMYQRRYWSARTFAEVAAYKTIAEQQGLSLVELSYAWLRARPSVDSIIVGPATVAHLDAALDAQSLSLDQATLNALDAIYTEHQGTDARYARI